MFVLYLIANLENKKQNMPKYSKREKKNDSINHKIGGKVQQSNKLQ
jgi:hypothetical protein